MITELTGVLVTIALWLALGAILGRYLASALQSPSERGVPHWSDHLFGPFERVLYRLIGMDAEAPMTWRTYAGWLLASNALMALFVYAGLCSMGQLPLNPDHVPGMEPSLAFNSAASFIANTNLQHYSGESGMSYFGQLFLLMFLQFTSAASGMAVFIAVCRALRNRESANVGNFIGDLVRSIVRVLLPLSLVTAVLLMAAGCPMTFKGAAEYTGIDGTSGRIARGPVAALVAIKHWGTNGGGFFGANSTHPFENPNYLSNMLEVIVPITIPLAAVWAFGYITRRRRVAAAIFSAMAVILFTGAAFAMWQEWRGNISASALGFQQPLGNYEGKEVRFGVMASAWFTAVTTATSCGAVNNMHDSLTPLAGLVPLTNMWVNCVFGGVGVGFINMFLYIVLTVFIAGLMVGRTPEFLGKKIEVREVKLAGLAILAHPALILLPLAITCAVPAWNNSTNPGAHGFTEMLYEYTSAAANNGSGFEGLNDAVGQPWWNISTGLVMLFARYIPIIAPLAIAASLGQKKTVPESVGTFRTDNVLFVILLLGVIGVIGALLFLPVAVLGPIAEFLSQIKGVVR